MTNTDHKRNQRSRRGKGGRPPKKVKRRYVMTVRLTDTECFLIGDKARRAGMRPSEWFRRAAKRARVLARISPEDQRQLRMLAGLANNLNQLVRLAHTDGLLTVQKKCRDILRKIDEQLTNLNNDRESDHGKSFGSCLRYLMNRPEATVIDAEGVRMNSARAAATDFNLQRKMNPGLGKAAGHLILSWSKEDRLKLSPEIMCERAREYLEKMRIRS